MTRKAYTKGEVVTLARRGLELLRALPEATERDSQEHMLRTVLGVALQNMI